ncbi:MAG: hypothetical protein VB778_04155 [Nitrospinaceae bacterium]
MLAVTAHDNLLFGIESMEISKNDLKIAFVEEFERPHAGSFATIFELRSIKQR